MPVLGRRIGAVLASGELSVEELALPDQDEPRPVLRYFDHVFPIRTGTEHLPLVDLVAAQHYRLAYWRVADEELNTGASSTSGRGRDPGRGPRGLRRHPPHRRGPGAQRRGRRAAIDDPDGLADPQDTWPDSPRPWTRHGWSWRRSSPPPRTCPTTGRPPGARATTRCGASSRCSSTRPAPGPGRAHAPAHRRHRGRAAFLVERAKREIVAGRGRRGAPAGRARRGDLRRRVRLRDHTRRALQDCLVELLVAADRYRYYVVPASHRAAKWRPSPGGGGRGQAAGAQPPRDARLSRRCCSARSRARRDAPASRAATSS